MMEEYVDSLLNPEIEISHNRNMPYQKGNIEFLNKLYTFSMACS
jgi:hypothetical protein